MSATSKSTEVETFYERKYVPAEQTWNVNAIYAGAEQFEADFKTVKDRTPELVAYKGRLSESGAVLLEAFQLSDELSRLAEKVYVYAHLRVDEDTRNNDFQKLYKRVQRLYSDFSEALSYMRPEILAISEDQLKLFIESTPGLELYKRQLEELCRYRAHIRSEEVETLLSQMAEINQGPQTTFTALNNADFQFPKITVGGVRVQVTHANYGTLLLNQNRSVRRQAFNAVFNLYEHHGNTLAANYSTRVSVGAFHAKARNYGSAIEAALNADDLPLSLYDSLTVTVHSNLGKLQQYLELRRRILGVKKLTCYDLYVPLVKEVDFKVTYEEAKEFVLGAVSVLGDEYVQTLSHGLGAGRWVDYANNVGKKSGAYSSGCYDTQPYILMSWQPTLESIFTLAHEAGHSMHSHLSRTNQPYPYADYTIFVAEVASTCNEALLAHHMLQTCTNPALRRYIINRQLESVRQTLYRQTLFAEFERIAFAKAEAGEPLTLETLCEIHFELNKQYYAPATTLDNLIRYEWARIPHFFTPFYVFKYSTGLAAALALSKQILTEGEPAVRRYLKFLSSGSSKKGLELLQGAGVDLSTPQPVQLALDYFGELLTEFENSF